MRQTNKERAKERMFDGRNRWIRYNVSKLLQNPKRRRYCTSTTSSNNPNNSSSSNTNGGGVKDIRDLEAYRNLDKLDFMKAAKILFTNSPKKKKFGLDFHLVQLFFALMPSLAVYLVAQYARSEMRKMDAELELKKKAEEEEKAREMEAKAAEEKAKGSELLEVKERLKALEVTVKDIVVEKKKQTIDEKSKNATQSQRMEDPQSRSDNSHATPGRQRTPTAATPDPDKQRR